MCFDFSNFICISGVNCSLTPGGAGSAASRVLAPVVAKPTQTPNTKPANKRKQYIRKDSLGRGKRRAPNRGAGNEREQKPALRTPPAGGKRPGTDKRRPGDGACCHQSAAATTLRQIQTLQEG